MLRNVSRGTLVCPIGSSYQNLFSISTKQTRRGGLEPRTNQCYERHSTRTPEKSKTFFENIFVLYFRHNPKTTKFCDKIRSVVKTNEDTEMTFNEQMTINEQVENAFEILKEDLAKRNFLPDTIPSACLGVAKGIIQAMLIRMEDQEKKQYYLDLIRNLYK